MSYVDENVAYCRSLDIEVHRLASSSYEADACSSASVSTVVAAALLLRSLV